MRSMPIVPTINPYWLLRDWSKRSLYICSGIYEWVCSYLAVQTSKDAKKIAEKERKQAERAFQQK